MFILMALFMDPWALKITLLSCLVAPGLLRLEALSCI